MMSVLALFTAPNDTDLAAYECDTGESFTVHTGTGSIQSNALQATAGILRATVAGDVRGTVSATITALGGISPAAVGLIWRWQDANNYWYSSSYNDIVAGGNRYQVRKVVAGSDSRVAGYSAGPVPAVNDVVSAVFDPAGVRLAVNGVVLGSIADVALASASRIGLFMPSGIEGNGPMVDGFGFDNSVWTTNRRVQRYSTQRVQRTTSRRRTGP
jgi:hypothetical protein